MNKLEPMIKVVGKRPIDKSKIHRILIRTTNWVGDVVMTLPAMEAVRANFPESTIAVLAKPWVIPLLENHPAVDLVIPLSTGGGPLSHMFTILKSAGLIRRMGFDLAILFQNAFEAALLAYLGGVRLRVGYNTDVRGPLLSHAVVRNGHILRLNQVEYYLALLQAMGWRAQSRSPGIYIAEGDRQAVQSLLSSSGTGHSDFLLGISPGAVFGPAKRWPPERFAAIGDRAAERWGAKVLILGSGGEKDICRAVSRSMKHASLNLCGRTTLGEAMAFVERCQFLITNDSGLMHVAAALQVPLVALFGSTDPETTGPRSSKARVARRSVDCAPCLKSSCPADFRCMLDMTPAEVWNEMELLREEL